MLEPARLHSRLLSYALALMLISAGRNAVLAEMPQSARQDSQPARPDTQPQVDLRALLLPGRHAADIMTLGAQQRVVELERKLGEAVQKDTVFFRAYLKTATPDKVLAYHPKMGLTEAEYREYLVLSPQLVPRKTGETVLTISPNGNALLLDAGERVPALRRILIDPKNAAAETSLGQLEGGSFVRSDEMQSLTGRWYGMRWTMPRGLGAAAALTIGKMETSPKGLIYYEVKYVDAIGQVRGWTTMLLYELTPAPAPADTVKPQKAEPTKKKKPSRRKPRGSTG